MRNERTATRSVKQGQKKGRLSPATTDFWMERGLGKRMAKLSAIVYSDYLSDLDESRFDVPRQAEAIVLQGLIRLVDRHHGEGWFLIWKPERRIAFDFDVAGICLEVSHKLGRRWAARDDQGPWARLAGQIEKWAHDKIHVQSPDIFGLAVKEHLRRLKRRKN